MPRPELSCPATSDTGAYRLSWAEAGDDLHAVFEHAPDGTSRVIYEGADGATTVSGRAPGVYAYEVHDTSARSSSCEVEVAPPSLTLAFALFAIGALITAATVGLVLWGHRAHRRGDLG